MAASPSPAPGERDEPVQPVTTLELFFDLVFVFTITQLTELLVTSLDAVGIAQVLLLFGVSWWMYGGYVWLTNNVTPDRAGRQLLLLVAMSAFLVQALSIPHAFDRDGIAFGLAYLVVVVVHGILFRQATRAITRLVPFNIASALLVIAAGFVRGGTPRYALWSLAMAVQFVAPYLSRVGAFRVQSGHFVERHGLLMLVAFGESVVAIGIGAAGLPVNAGVIGAAVLGLALVACLWWAYFVGDAERAERALAAAPPDERPALAINGFFYAHIPMLLGVVFIAAGVTKAIGHAAAPLGPGPAAALAVGAAIYLVGDVAFRRILRIDRGSTRTIVAIGALATFPLGGVSAALQLVMLVGVFVAGYVAEAVAAAREPE
ncbi:MAG TPA: low temperature requirement protein A [Gemmatimonadaceae bacterium]